VSLMRLFRFCHFKFQAFFYGGLAEYGIFISHSWDYDPDYFLLMDILHSARSLRWRNCSVPRPERDREGVSGLYGRLVSQISSSDCVIVISDMYERNSFWISKELDIARRLGKPVIALRSRWLMGLPGKIMSTSSAVAGWDPEDLAVSVRRLCFMNLSPWSRI